MNFVDFAAAHGLMIDRLVEGRWVRVKTTDKTKKRNGAYKFLGDVGFVQNHATMDRVSVWRPDGGEERVSRAYMREVHRKSVADERVRQEKARATAEDMVKRAMVDYHPYLAAKGFPQEKGLVLENELLIPMRDFTNYKALNSLQRIATDGSKLFLPGGKAKGSVFFIGPYMARERWLVEGYATGLSVRAALRDMHCEAQIIVCFSAGNLAHVGRLAKDQRTPAYVFADNDESGAGEKAAKDSGLPWTMAPEVKHDANDWHQKYGLWALAKLIREVRTAERVRGLRAG